MPRAKSPNRKASGANGDAGTNGATAAATKTAISALQTSSAIENNTSQTQTPRLSRATDSSVHPSVSEEQIRRRAYELYVQRGGTHGRHMDDWFRAESELLGRAS
ncbi:MAG TPA: DUF2934 domain-containing protein [Terriglobales bacterium]|jgi:CheY-like chemotaxis protein|nr:DUF2934 domain-containing protein [Terriglobales bacterium]